MKIAVYPKCYEADLVSGRMSLFEWIEMASALGAEGLEIYEGFFESLDERYLDRLRRALRRSGFEMPMLCCSPDFTHPDVDRRRDAREREKTMIRVTAELGGGWCRVLSGQRHAGVSRRQGITWVLQAYHDLFPIAREAGVVLAMENHYKDGFWKYPEFAQHKEPFLEIVRAVPPGEPFGVQFDPSNAIVAGDDPIELLEQVKDRVVTMHASDRYLDPSGDSPGGPPVLRHGVIGRGLNDYDRIFAILAEVGFDGWVSVEDGLGGLGEMKESVSFLKTMRRRHFGSGKENQG
jgi:sugar phosphate isomerase/epimerase